MNILLIGSGGREHALAWKIKQSPLCRQLFIAPGNAGTAQCGTNLPISINDFAAIAEKCIALNIDLLVVGPEEPLVNGIYDFFKSNSATKNTIVIGASQAAAQLEGSKAFAKAFMQRHQIPTAGYAEFTHTNYAEGTQYIRNHSLPVVLKADGLAAGKGVLICTTTEEALAEFELMIQQKKFGEAGKKVVVEAFLDGIELSVFVLTDGENYCLLPEAKDYKRIGEADSGLNTGGMGAISPVPFANGAFMQTVIQTIIEPTISGLQKEKLAYTGFVFFGLIKVGNDPFVIEYNCRLGDPETEAILPRLKNDLVELFIATSQLRLNEIKIDVEEKNAVSIVAVSGGYPGAYKKGFPIHGLTMPTTNNSLIFHAGTKYTDEKTVTDGGRVLVVTALANSLAEASLLSNATLKKISFENMHFRKDIGYEFN